MSIRHRMTSVNNFPSGAVEWFCPFCERRLILGGNPSILTIINRGDETIAHYGGTGGLEITGIDVSAHNEES